MNGTRFFFENSCRIAVLFLTLIICSYNVYAVYAQLPAATNPLEGMIPSAPVASQSSLSLRANDITNIIDKPGSNSLQLCIATNMNSGSITGQAGTSQCSLSNEVDDSLSSLSRNSLIFCPSSIVLPSPCVGTEDDDIIYGARTTPEIFALAGNDMVFGHDGDTRMFGGKDDDLIVAGAGNDLVDGGPNDDVLLAGGGSDLLVGGKGNDKLFNGAGTAIMYGGKGANHFDCSLSALGLARSVVMDYNPSKGDTISGPCKIVNNLSDDSSERIKNIPQDTLPDTGETSSSSNNEIIAGSLIGS
jgi:hypothetical protein